MYVVDSSIQVLFDGPKVLIFPEGELSHEGMKFSIGGLFMDGFHEIKINKI